MKSKANYAKKSFLRVALVLIAVLTVTSGLIGAPKASAQTCATTTAPPATYGSVTQPVSVTTAGSYRVWSRIKVPNTTANSYYLQFDGGCAINVGDSTGIPANTWTWVNYQAGATANVINVTLTAGSHTLKYTGKEADVQLDRVLLLSDTGCVPTGTGENCANVDAINPTVSLTSPTNGQSVSPGFPVSMTANATDNVGVTKVEFYVNGVVVNSDTTSPYTYTWATTGVATGTKVMTARAYDAAGNTTTSAPVNLIVGTASSDISLPNVAITAPASGSSAAIGTTVNITANATDNVGVTRVEFYNGTTLLGNDTTSPYSWAWNTTGQTAGAKNLTAKAFDAAGNNRTSMTVTVNLTGGTTNIQGDANGDGRVNAIDLSILITHDGENYAAADFNKDGQVGAADLAILLSRWTW
jgi:hypothetical protein